MSTPTTAEVVKIAAMNDPVARNYLITECYRQLSAAMVERAGEWANWCTFATFASRQAGETIRKEDLKLAVLRRLGEDRLIEELLQCIYRFALRAGINVSQEKIKQSIVVRVVSNGLNNSAAAVARGNNKVFAEIGWQFARFIELCVNNRQYEPACLQSFVGQLKNGDPPEGQRYLAQAFTRYYNSFFEPDIKKATELRFFANLEIGYHEQTRLQPEIAAALNAVIIEPEIIADQFANLLSERAGFWKKLLFTVRTYVGTNGLLKEKTKALAGNISERMRMLLTAQLMTLTIPPRQILLLGTDLQMKYPGSLTTISNEELKDFLKRVDPTTDSLLQTGAIEWANFNERMHFITDLFRCCHENRQLFAEIND